MIIFPALSVMFAVAAFVLLIAAVMYFGVQRDRRAWWILLGALVSVFFSVLFATNA